MRMRSFGEWRIDELIHARRLPPGPIIIGATGGSGTRVVARIVRHGGMFIGTHLNESEDALDFGTYSDRWINSFLKHTARWVKPLPADIELDMIQDLQELLGKHVAPLVARDDAGSEWKAWGWKEPRSIYLLPFWHRQFPTLKFLHIIRDGRDMAFSPNQNQLRKHGEAMLDSADVSGSQPLQSMALWSRINSMAADYGERYLRDRYLRIRFEDLCEDPVTTIRRIFDFFCLEGDVEKIAYQEVRSPASLGRW